MQNIYSSDQTHQGSTLTLLHSSWSCHLLYNPQNCQILKTLGEKATYWMSRQIGSRTQAAYYSRRLHFKEGTLKRRSNLQPLPLFTAIHVWGWMKCWFLSGRVLTPPSAPPWPFPHLLTPGTIYVCLGHLRPSHGIERYQQFQFWCQSEWYQGRMAVPSAVHDPALRPAVSDN